MCLSIVMAIAPIFLFIQQQYIWLGNIVKSHIQEKVMTENMAVQKQSPYPIKSVEGWILIITNLYEEIQQDDLFDAFSKFGEIKSLHLNLDRKTGYAKGYSLIQYANFQQANSAIKEMNGQQLFEKRLVVDWAFQEKPLFQKKKAKS